MSKRNELAEPIAFGKYLLDAEIARGGMSRVYRARLREPTELQQPIAIKQILPELAADPEFIELFAREAKTLVQLSHPNIVPVYELGVVDGVYFLAMELVHGATLAQVLRTAPLPAPLVAHVGAQIADALHYAHTLFGLVHRDVTPRNIIIDASGHARLLDFGVAARADQTGRGELFGSRGYMAPEHLRGEALSPQSDLFALGSVLYEARSGVPAWPGVRDSETFSQCPTPAPLTNSDGDLSAVIHALLEIDPRARPESAALVAERLRTWLSKTHARGAAPELSARVASVQAQERFALLRRAPAREHSGRIEVRSIAQSRELTALLRQRKSTQPQPETESLSNEPQDPRESDKSSESDEPPSSHPEEPRALPQVSNKPEFNLADDPEFHNVARRFIRDIIVVTLALLAALIYARARPYLYKSRPEPADSDTTAPYDQHDQPQTR